MNGLEQDGAVDAGVPDKPETPKPETPKAKTPKKKKDTQDEFVEALGELVDSFRNAGERFLEMIAGTSVKRGTDIMDDLLAPLEEGKDKKKGGKKAL